MSKVCPPRALLLDLDNTLVARDAALAGWLAGLGLDARTERLILELDRGGHGARAAFFAALGAALGIGASTARARLQLELPAHVRPEPRVAAWLDAFPGTKVVVSNGATAMQQAKLEAAGLLQHVDGLLTSAAHGAAKPQASIFHAALAMAGVAAAEACMIGDHPRDDVAGARAVGLATCMVRSRWFQVPAGVDSVAAITEVVW